MLTNTERQAIVDEVNAGTYGIDEALDDIAAAQKGEEVRKALYAEALVLNREGHAGSTDMIARQQVANLQTSVNGQISTLRTEVGEDIDDLETALNSGLATQNGKIAAQDATIANVVANYNVEYGSTELWASTGETGALAAGTTVTLSEDVSHFDYIDIYSFCGNSNVLDTVPVDAKLQSSQGYALRWVNLSDPDSGSYKAYVRIIETRLHIIGTTLTIDHQVTYRNGEEVNISGAEITQSNRSTYMGELGIMKVVGRKITANTELEDVRIGADGTEYASAGQAVRAQVTALESAIPAVDSTLSMQGAAADAKIVGDEFTNVKADLNAVSDMQNITAKVTGFEQGYRHKRQNASLVVNSKCVCTTAVVEFKSGQTISVASGYEYMIVDPDPANNGALLITRRATDYTFAEATAGYVEVRIRNEESDITPADVSGIVVTITTSFKIVSVAQNAYDRAFKIIKFVSTSGNDANTGDSPSTAYATIGKALSETADVIYIAKGTYIEDLTEYIAYRYRDVKIVADGATLISNGNGLHFRFANVDISGLSVVSGENPLTTTKSGFHLLNCTGRLTDCSADGFPNIGIRIDGCRMTLTRCFAINNGLDGFNGHTVNDGYDTECTLIDCVAYGNGDDGASIHENGKMFVYGGEYYNNVQTGLAPHDKCVFAAFNVHCHHNGKGIEAVKDTLASGETPAVGRVIGCILNDNTTYGLDVKNYTVNTLANGYANNGTAPTNTQTGGTINAFSVG